MPNFNALCLHWLKRLFRTRNILILSAILLVSIYSGYGGASAYENVTVDSKEFLTREASIFKTRNTYAKYSVTGIGVFFVPAPASVFFSSPAITSELAARFNTIAEFSINGDQGRFKFGGHSRFNFRLSGIVRILLSFFAIYLVFELVRSRAYLKTLAGRFSDLKVHLSIVFSSFIFLVFGFFLALGGAIGGMLLHRVPFSAAALSGLGGYIITALLMILFFVVMGIVVGNIRDKVVAFISLLVVWFVFVFAIPGITDAVFNEIARDIATTNKLFNEKLKIITDFEIKTAKEKGAFSENPEEKRREIVEYYWANVFPKLEALDRGRRDKIAKLLEKYNTVSIFTITTFYNLMADETGSRGYGSYVVFYDYLLALRKAFSRFWIDRVYYADPKKMVSFIKETENLYHSESRRPDNFGTGLVFNLAVILFLLLPISFGMFKRYLYTLDNKQPAQKKNRGIILGKKELKVYRLINPIELGGKLYNLLSGKPAYNKAVPAVLEIDNVDFTVNRKKADFFYICNPEIIPGDMKVKDFLSFCFRTCGISRDTKQEIRAALGRLITGASMGKLSLRQKE
ncbi:MAG: hypothetical protein GY950_16050, partial [bacterium]|nr:hypothetical protein [bacterium]